MGKRIVIALGGNALGKNLPEQMEAVQHTARAIVDLIEQGNEVIVVHGNGPQVGMIANAMTELTRSDPQKYIPCPLSVCGAMSQGYIGYDLQNALREEMERRGIAKGVATVLTQVEVDPEDPAFKNPTKPIGSFMTEDEAEQLKRDRGYDFVEDSGRGYRRVVASPEPKKIVEYESILNLLDNEFIVIACGGGGIPVVRNYDDKGAYRGIAAVIDKDMGGELLAEDCHADMLVLLTAVDHVAINFGKPDQKDLEDITVAEAKQYLEQGQFGKGSMEPKVRAAVKFAESRPGRVCIIGSLEKAAEAMAGLSGTRIHE